MGVAPRVKLLWGSWCRARRCGAMVQAGRRVPRQGMRRALAAPALRSNRAPPGSARAQGGETASSAQAGMRAHVSTPRVSRLLHVERGWPPVAGCMTTTHKRVRGRDHLTPHLPLKHCRPLGHVCPPLSSRPALPFPNPVVHHLARLARPDTFACTTPCRTATTAAETEPFAGAGDIGKARACAQRDQAAVAHGKPPTLCTCSSLQSIGS